ncbi:MAG: phosphate ABC transporter substrate-binding protein [Gallionella sp.]|jgi:ABC-type phosphate transport system substrate-binding protein
MFVANAYADVVVIVSARSAVNRLTAEQTGRIFLGKVNAFPGGGNVVPVDQSEGTAIRDEFYARIVRKSAAQLTAYWAKMVFTGDGFPPKLLNGNVAVKHAVSNDPEAIGYIDRSAVDSSVKVVLDPQGQ